ncbi:MAG: hypothetical protein M0Q15_02800 [Nevskia sp.]|nr:hypothetical protein [Nevskia sp.]
MSQFSLYLIASQSQSAKIFSYISLMPGDLDVQSTVTHGAGPFQLATGRNAGHFLGHEVASLKIKFFAAADIRVILKQCAATDHAS